MKIKRVRILSARLWAALSLMCVAGCLAIFVGTARTQTDEASCGPLGAQTVVADANARIYRVRIGHSFIGTLYAYYGCTVARGKAEWLTATDTLTRVRMVELRGAIAGLIVDRHGVDTGSSTLTVRDLADGRVLHQVVTAYMVPRIYGRLVTYVLTSSGDIAWSTVKSIGFGPGGEVTISRAIGHSLATLDQGTSIRASSLRLHGHTVQWIDGGRRRHARLP